ncbi:CpaD family pilus assembly protein [Erythrobacter crassostreae]|uniref:CpaD family pilus assembly protein n=1 Tax=Erythrobacter crassostreae TaxID=2828328 RepID=A0A9X1JKN4_9SPHN|nr:CpaD family pilus assembly protein [Erythrobacter crassostrea]MBV7259255.1 CpaD family pilus assembly protein [Erythrobacter crassostrea]
MLIAQKGKLAGALALSIGLVTAGCGGVATNTSLYSTKQAVVERTNFTFDVQTNASGLPIGEQSRLNGWFEAMDLRYGDRVTIEDPANSTAVSTAVNDLAGRYGIIVSKVAPATSGYLNPGQARVVITRSTASVPGCPDWSAKSDTNYMNASSPGYGCGVNSNLAAMVANPEDLLEGQKGSGEQVIVTGTKAIDTYREATPTGAGGLQNAQGDGGQ